MLRRHQINAGIYLVLFIFILSVFLMWLTSFISTLFASAMAILIILAAISGLILPGILLTWIIILCLAADTSILMLGYVVMSNPQKMLLLFSYPILASLFILSRSFTNNLRLMSRNRTEIESYLSHYNPIVKLQTTYNADKLYKKEAKFIANEKAAHLEIHIAAIHWVHNNQLKQFHQHGYEEALREIAKVLKENRFPSEQLYYLSNGTFLIISYALVKETYDYKNNQTKELLENLRFENLEPQYKWGILKVDQTNVEKYPTLETVLSKLQREMETDLVVEYLQGVKANG